MTPDQARDLFSAAHEAELTDDERAQFEATLQADAALAAEYTRFVNMLSATQLSGARSTPAPNLLPKIQARIRKRSRGRFFRDRFAEGGGMQPMLPLLAGGVMLLMLVALWLMAQTL